MGPTKAEISHASLRHNFNLIRDAVSPSKVMGVVKANAYGHGIIETARTLVKNRVDYLGVAFSEEGLILRKAGIKTPVLVFGAHHQSHFANMIKNNLEITLTDTCQLKPLIQIAKEINTKASVQIKLDTGMHRVGFIAEQSAETIERILKEKWFDVKGVYSHFSSADETDLDFSLGQLRRFLLVKEKIESRYDKALLFHMANSAAIMRLPQSYMDIVRPGVMLYGNPPGPEFTLTWNLQEVMRFVSQVALIKKLNSGDPVSYNRHYTAQKPTKVAIIPAGYADGFNRLRTNKGQVLIHGRRYPVAGTVCMDMIMVDIGLKSDMQIGDEVVLMGKQGDEHIKNVEVSRLLGTIPYEVTCSISARVQREHVYS